MISERRAGGNFYDKYRTKNPLEKRLVSGFFKSFDQLVNLASPAETLEIGCGEGELSLRLSKRKIKVYGFDISEQAITKAKANASSAKLDSSRFEVADVFHKDLRSIKTDLVVCCEVLEHLDEPQIALKIISSIDSRYFLFSVPNEPIWRFLNIARGAYIHDFGNTPGHVNHWSSKSFFMMLERFLSIKETRRPLPWSMALCHRHEYH